MCWHLASPLGAFFALLDVPADYEMVLGRSLNW